MGPQVFYLTWGLLILLEATEPALSILACKKCSQIVKGHLKICIFGQ